MKKIRNIINSSTPPSTDSMWLNGQSALYYTDGKWTQLGVSPEEVTNIINNNALDQVIIESSGYYAVGTKSAFTDMQTIFKGENAPLNEEGLPDGNHYTNPARSVIEAVQLNSDGSSVHTGAMYIYLDGTVDIPNLQVSKVNSTKAVTVSSLASSATLANVISAYNSLLAALSTVGAIKL